jgi:biotin transport system substrate-specific component
MTTATLAPSRLTLADRVVPRSVVNNIALMLTGVAVVSATALIEIPMWPVPISGQTLGVMLVGASLGAWRGAVSLATYMLLGLAGLPIFAGGAGGLLSVATPSFGFIIGFIAAAAFIGWLAERNWDKRPVLSLFAFLGASIVPFLFGIPYMGMILGTMGLPTDLGSLLGFGFYPFIAGGVVKWLLAASILPLAWRLVKSVDDKRDASAA